MAVAETSFVYPLVVQQSADRLVDAEGVSRCRSRLREGAPTPLYQLRHGWQAPSPDAARCNRPHASRCASSNIGSGASSPCRHFSEGRRRRLPETICRRAQQDNTEHEADTKRKYALHNEASTAAAPGLSQQHSQKEHRQTVSNTGQKQDDSRGNRCTSSGQNITQTVMGYVIEGR